MLINKSPEITRELRDACGVTDTPGQLMPRFRHIFFSPQNASWEINISNSMAWEGGAFNWQGQHLQLQLLI